MHVQFRKMLLISMLAAVPFTLAACGKSDDKKTGGGSSGSQTAAVEGQKGGTLTIDAASDVDYFDCGKTYYQLGFVVTRGLCRTLYGYDSGQKLTDTPKPDLAEGQPEVSADQKTITVKIKKGIKFAPPVNREITAKDIEYSLERAFTTNVPNGYVTSYLASIQGVPAQPGKFKDIPGIEAVDDSTLKFTLTKPAARTIVAAMVMPVFTAVPKEIAEKFDKKQGSKPFLIATGPYMVKSAPSGEAIGYKPGKQIELVRNPNWDSKTDFRKAYLDKVLIKVGATDARVSARGVLEGSGKATMETVPPDVLQQSKRRYPQQITSVPSGGGRYIALNTAKPPFNNKNLRYAVIAGMDREALLATRGGALAGKIAQHYLPPGFLGFDQSGGESGTGIDILANPKGDPALSAEYMKKAGYPSGKYTGSKPITIIGGNVSPGKETTQAVQAQLEKLGFKTKLRLAPQDAVYSKFCNVPKNEPEVCATVGWFKDFADPQSMLQPLFDGKAIKPENNANWGQINDPEINQLIEKASVQPAGPENVQAWADINKKAVEQGGLVPYIWDFNNSLHSKDVQFAVDPYNYLVDIAFTSIKK